MRTQQASTPHGTQTVPQTPTCGSPLPVLTKRKAEDDDMEDEEQLDKWIAEINAAKILREECKEKISRLSKEMKLAQEEKDAADSQYEELTDRLLAALIKNRKRVH